jgi:hypothetical protein
VRLLARAPHACQLRLESASAGDKDLSELLTEGLDRKLHLDKFKRTLARIPSLRPQQRPQSAPVGTRGVAGAAHHRRRESSSSELEGEVSDVARWGEDLGGPREVEAPQGLCVQPFVSPGF